MQGEIAWSYGGRTQFSTCTRRWGYRSGGPPLRFKTPTEALIQLHFKKHLLILRISSRTQMYVNDHRGMAGCPARSRQQTFIRLHHTNDITLPSALIRFRSLTQIGIQLMNKEKTAPPPPPRELRAETFSKLKQNRIDIPAQTLTRKRADNTHIHVVRDLRLTSAKLLHERLCEERQFRQRKAWWWRCPSDVHYGKKRRE